MASLKQQFEKGLKEAQQIYADPKRATTTYRAAGFWLTLVGIAFSVGNYAVYTQNGRVWAVLLAINLVTLLSGLFMLVTGKNPFARFRR